MAYLNETPEYEEGIHQLETTDPVVGGPEGVSNTPLKQLANRTAWLREQLSLAVPAGAVMSFASATAPDGWLECNGASLSRTTYDDLFNAIGIIFGGGDGATTFNLPDLRGEFIRGFDSGRGVDVGRVIGSWQMASHIAHDEDGHHVHGISTPASALTHGLEPPTIAPNNSAATQSWVEAVGKNLYIDPNIHPTNNFRSSMKPRNLALMFCIKY